MADSRHLHFVMPALPPESGHLYLGKVWEVGELADSWEPVLRVDVSFDAASNSLLMGGPAPRDLLTAIYRVVEQALLNAASRGSPRPSSETVRVTVPEDGTVRVTSTRDAWPCGEVVRGSGTAIMDAWCCRWRGVGLATDARRWRSGRHHLCGCGLRQLSRG